MCYVPQKVLGFVIFNMCYIRIPTNVSKLNWILKPYILTYSIFLQKGLRLKVFYDLP